MIGTNDQLRKHSSLEVNHYCRHRLALTSQIVIVLNTFLSMENIEQGREIGSGIKNILSHLSRCKDY